MCIWSDGGKVSRVHGVLKRYQGQPDKIRVIVEMVSPKNVKEVQSLNGKVAALNRFVLRATDKCLPFFRMLKKSFEWMAECQQAFEDLKAYLSSPSLLSPSQIGEKLFLYLVPDSRHHGLS